MNGPFLKINKLKNEDQNKTKNYIDQVSELSSFQDVEGCSKSTNSYAAFFLKTASDSTAASSSCEVKKTAVEPEMPVYATVKKGKKPSECVYAVVNKNK